MPGYSASPRHRVRLLVAWIVGLATLSCAPATWRPVSYLMPGALPPETRLQVWRCGRSMVLRDVTVERDSVRGRVVDPLGGQARGQVVLAQADIDSLRQQPRDPANWFGAGLGLGIVGTIVAPYLLRLIGPRGA